MDSEYPDVVRTLAEKKEISDDVKEKLLNAAKRFKESFAQSYQTAE